MLEREKRDEFDAGARPRMCRYLYISVYYQIEHVLYT